MVEDGAKLQALVYDILPLEEGAEKTMLGVWDGAGVERGPFRVQTP